MALYILSDRWRCHPCHMAITGQVCARVCVCVCPGVCVCVCVCFQSQRFLKLYHLLFRMIACTLAPNMKIRQKIEERVHSEPWLFCVDFIFCSANLDNTEQEINWENYRLWYKYYASMFACSVRCTIFWIWAKNFSKTLWVPYMCFLLCNGMSISQMFHLWLWKKIRPNHPWYIQQVVCMIWWISSFILPRPEMFLLISVIYIFVVM